VLFLYKIEKLIDYSCIPIGIVIRIFKIDFYFLTALCIIKYGKYIQPYFYLALNFHNILYKNLLIQNIHIKTICIIYNNLLVFELHKIIKSIFFYNWYYVKITTFFWFFRTLSKTTGTFKPVKSYDADVDGKKTYL